MFRTTKSTPPASRTTPRQRLQQAFGLLALASLLGSCAGTPTAPQTSVTATPARVRFMDYREGMAFELVNESHTDRVELYSSLRSDSTIKVTKDEVMGALLEFLESKGFQKHARSGFAPRTSGTFRWGGEIETGGRTVFMVVGDQTPGNERNMFLDCYMNHVKLWSNVFQLQRVDTAPGVLFKERKPSR